MVNGDFSIVTISGSLVAWELTAPGENQRSDYVTGAGEAHVRLFTPTTGTESWPEATSEPFPVRPHTDYRLLAETRTSTHGRLLLALVFLDEDGDEILLRGIGSPAVTRSDWATVEGVIESPAAAASAYAVARLATDPESSENGAQSVDVSRISVQEVLGSGSESSGQAGDLG